MSTETARKYVGQFTGFYLEQIKRGNETKASLVVFKKRNPELSRGIRISIQEALSILDADTAKPPKELIAEMSEYQSAILEIARDPDRYTVGALMPETARAWYEQQISQMREILQRGAEA